MKGFSERVIAWYHVHKRALPWRETHNPYYIWLSEIILQQTRVDQGLDYYHKFVKAFPGLSDLAAADEEKVLKLWQGLGYYSRARNLHSSAKYICSELKGRFPSRYDEIIKLKGVGRYTAAAIASFAFNEARAAVDGNVYRVLARVFGISSPIDSGKGAAEFQQLADKLIDKSQPGTFNQAIMEFGAVQCRPVNPDCRNCPLTVMCYAKENNAVAKLPVKEKKTKSRNRYFDYLVLRGKTGLVLKKRKEKDIWKNLYDFPLIESESKTTEAKLSSGAGWQKLLPMKKYKVNSVSKTYVHVLSHQKIHARFWEIRLEQPLKKLAPGWIWVDSKKLPQYAVPRLIEKYIHLTHGS